MDLADLFGRDGKDSILLGGTVEFYEKGVIYRGIIKGITGEATEVKSLLLEVCEAKRSSDVPEYIGRHWEDCPSPRILLKENSTIIKDMGSKIIYIIVPDIGLVVIFPNPKI